VVRTGAPSDCARSNVTSNAAQTWNSDYTRGKIREVELHGGDVSQIVAPCTPATNVSVPARALSGRALADAVGLEVRGHSLAVMRAVGEPDGEPEAATIVCPTCNGTGRISTSADVDHEDETEAGASNAPAASKYSAQELKAMMKTGCAMPNASGQPSYPIGDEDDVRRRCHGRRARLSRPRGDQASHHEERPPAWADAFDPADVGG
jgi:hypothetical protein